MNTNTLINNYNKERRNVLITQQLKTTINNSDKIMPVDKKIIENRYTTLLQNRNEKINYTGEYYKVIMPELLPKNIKSKEDLIICRTKDIDRTTTLKEYDNRKKIRHQETENITKLYSNDNKSEHEKKFKSSYVYIPNIDNANIDIKNNSLSYFEEMQKQKEKEKKICEDIISILLEKKQITEEDVKKYTS